MEITAARPVATPFNAQNSKFAREPNPFDVSRVHFGHFRAILRAYGIMPRIIPLSDFKKR